MSMVSGQTVADDNISKWTFDRSTSESSISVRSSPCRRNKNEGSQITFTWTVPELKQSKDKKRVTGVNRSRFFKKASVTCGCNYVLVINEKYELSGTKLPELMQGELPKEIENFSCKATSNNND
jgi:hypothetical protein